MHCYCCWQAATGGGGVNEGENAGEMHCVETEDGGEKSRGGEGEGP